eukprot:m.58719 g.58719  ORF g.58719 m.58719 type:complete len:101 (+) comp7878_c1_seq1:29-331(+)
MSQQNPPSYSQATQYQPQQQQAYYPPPQQQETVVVTVQPSAREQERNARRLREQRRTDMMLGLLCGGFLCCICVGPERAGHMGKNVADTLLCMRSDCGGF